MPEPSHDIQLTYRPRDGPRRRITFERDRLAGEWEYQYWRIEEVYDADDGVWREVGREHVDEPDLVLQLEGVGPITTADTEVSENAR